MSPSLIQALVSAGTQALCSFLLPSRPLQAFSASHRFRFSEFNRDSVPSDHKKTFTARMWDKEMSRVPVELFILIGGIIN